MQTKKDPFVELETQFSDIGAKKSKAINFLEARVQENTKLLKSIRPNKIHGSDGFEVISFLAIPSAIFATKTLLALGLGVAVGAAATTVLLPITTTLLCFKEGRQVVNDVVKSLTPELKRWKIPGAELRGGGIRGLENQSSIFIIKTGLTKAQTEVFWWLKMAKLFMNAMKAMPILETKY